MPGSLRAIASAFTLAIVSTTACDNRRQDAGASADLNQAKRQEKRDWGTPPSPAASEPAAFQCGVLVRGSTGIPLPAVQVDFLREDRVRVAGRMTDERGVARLRVPAGNYNVRLANQEGEVLAEVGYEVSGDTSTPIEVVLGRK
jgi:hypothetical protein